MLRAFRAIPVLILGGLVVAVLLVGAGFATERFSLPENTCPYGSKNTGSRSTLSCKPRPAPTAEQAAAVRDGSALKRAIAAFRAAGYGEAAIAGMGMNAWGETTFMLPTWTTQTGEARYRSITFDPLGGVPRQTQASSRGYVVDTGSETFTLRDADPEGALRALRKEAGPDFEKAVFTAESLGGTGWRLISKGRQDEVMVEAKGAGRGLPVFVQQTAAQQKAQSECAQRAGANPFKLQKCLAGEGG